MRALDTVWDKVKGGAVALLAAPALATAACAEEPALAADTAETKELQQREQPVCAELHQTESGRTLNGGTSAHAYSTENNGNVGISIFAGSDLGDHSPEFLGTALVNSLARRGVSAECFVYDELGENGTSVNFHIAGLAWDEDGSGLNISESLDAETLNSVAAEAKTAGMLITASLEADVY